MVGRYHRRTSHRACLMSFPPRVSMLVFAFGLTLTLAHGAAAQTRAAPHRQGATVRAPARAQATAPEAAVAGPSLPRAPSARGNIREAQRLLGEAGLYHGKMTGRMSRELADALRRYQQQNRLPVTGALDTETTARLTGRF